MSESQEVPLEEEEGNEIEVPERWKEIPLADYVDKGWKYRVKTKPNGTQYMCIRHRNQERSLGRYTPEREKLLYETFPKLKFQSQVTRSRGKGIGSRGLLAVPIKRVATIPRDYKPALEVIRYFQIFKNNGFPGDFSDFINGNIMDHFVRCNGVILPVLLEDIEVT